MSSSPKLKKFLGRASALSSKPRSRRWCGSPVASASSRLCSITTSIGSQLGSLGKGGSNLGEPSHKLAAQRLVVDLAFDRPGVQNLADRAPLRS